MAAMAEIGAQSCPKPSYLTLNLDLSNQKSANCLSSATALYDIHLSVQISEAASVDTSIPTGEQEIAPVWSMMAHSSEIAC